MESNQSEGLWKQAKGNIKRVFGKLTDDDVTEAEGNIEKLIGKVQQRYGEAKEAAAEKVNRFFDRYRARRPSGPPEKI